MRPDTARDGAPRPLRNLMLAMGVAGAALLAGAGTVSYYEEALPTTMNPLFARSMVDYRTHELVFDRLFYRDAITNRLSSRLVARHEKLEGGAKLKITLHEGIKWHDGQKLTAEDVCFTIDAMLNPRTPSTVAKDYRKTIQSCELGDDDLTAIITFKKVYHNPRERLGFSVIPAHAFESTEVSPDLDFSSRPVGTGPMRGSKGRQAVSFTRFPNGHYPDVNTGSGRPINSLSLSEGGDPFVQIKTLQNGGVQGVISVAPPLRPEVAGFDDVALKSYDLRSWWFIALNTSKGALRNQQVRQALNLTIDRTVLRELTIGVDPDDANPPCEFVSGPFVQSSPYYNRQVPVVPRSDHAGAKALMEQAGATQQVGKWIWDGAPISFKIGMSAPLDSEAKDLLNQIGNQLQEGGFDRQVYKVTADTWNRQAVTGQLTEYDLLIGKWSFGLVEDVNALFNTREEDKGQLNIFNYSNDDVDRILARYERARTDTEARDAYHDLHEALAQDLPYLFLWKLDTKSAWRNEVRGNIIAPYFYFTEFSGWRYE